MKATKTCVFLAFSIGDSSVSDFFSTVAKRLSHDHKVVIFTDTKNSLAPNDTIEVMRWPSKRPTKWKDFVFLRKAIKQHRPSLMLATFGANNIFLVTAYFMRVKHRYGTYRTLSTQIKSGFLKRIRKRWVYSLATKVIVNSKATKDDIMSHFGVKESKIEMRYNAVKAANISAKKEMDLISFAGRFHPTKGIDVLLRAFAKLLQDYPNKSLLIMGGTLKKDDEYFQLIEHLGIAKNVEIVGSVSKEEVLKNFARSSFVVVPSRSEAFGFVVIEAFCVKTPVLGSNTGGIKESIRDQVDGLLFEPGNHTDLYDKMKTLCDNPTLIAEYAVNCHQRFRDNYELERVASLFSENLTAAIKG